MSDTPSWRFTGQEIDHGDACETCELCGQEGLRYHFEIENRHDTNHHLWVGSVCILKFVDYDISGLPLDKAEIHTYLEGRKRKMAIEAKNRIVAAEQEKRQLMEAERTGRAIEAMDQLSAVETQSSFSKMIDSMTEHYHLHRWLSLKQGAVLFWRFKANKCAVDPSNFNIRVKYDQPHIARDMKDFQIANVWPALSAEDRAWIKQARVTPNATEVSE